ncbi:MAG: M81 family metallopeptidase [Dysgonamonadaceae bacterium]|jgi:microcystin degradation protein MlrC|nr:M81 family metallopeptidase [Dysgonamonadaceae bacterium]
MRKIILGMAAIFFASTAFFSCADSKKLEKDLPRIAIAGLAIESSTFSPAVTHEEDFRTRTGDSIFSYYPFFSADSATIHEAVWLPTLRGHAMPGGIVTREAYESLVQQTLDRLEEVLPLNGLFFDIHGAMSVQGLDDPEGDFIVRIRDVIGTDVLISTSMDLHGSVSPRLAQNTDLITCYRLAPHEDAIETKKRAVTNLLSRLKSGKGKPAYKAWIPVPVLLPGEQTSTRIEPAKSLYGAIPSLIDKDDVIDASIWMSYPWADEPRNHGVIVTYGDDKEAVGKAAEQLAKHYWSVRDEFDFVAPTTTWEEALTKAIASDKKPFIISDMGDNPTAGGAGDVTWTLTEILKTPEFKKPNGKSIIYASIPGPEFVSKAVEIGVGGQIDATAGAMVDNRFAPPVRIKGKITAIEHKDNTGQTEVVVKSGNASVIVTKQRMAYHYENAFTRLGLNPREADILVVKIGYLVPELYDMRADWIMALTPGGVDQDLIRLDYKRINRPMYPLDKDMEDPDLSARFIPLSDEIKR